MHVMAACLHLSGRPAPTDTVDTDVVDRTVVKNAGKKRMKQLWNVGDPWVDAVAMTVVDYGARVGGAAPAGRKPFIPCELIQGSDGPLLRSAFQFHFCNICDNRSGIQFKF